MEDEKKWLNLFITICIFSIIGFVIYQLQSNFGEIYNKLKIKEIIGIISIPLASAFFAIYIFLIPYGKFAKFNIILFTFFFAFLISTGNLINATVDKINQKTDNYNPKLDYKLNSTNRISKLYEELRILKNRVKKLEQTNP